MEQNAASFPGRKGPRRRPNDDDDDTDDEKRAPGRMLSAAASTPVPTFVMQTDALRWRLQLVRLHAQDLTRSMASLSTTSEAFVKAMTTLNPHVQGHHPTARTLKELQNKVYGICHDRLKREIQALPSCECVSATFDFWTDEHQSNQYVTVIIFWMDGWKLRQAVLATRATGTVSGRKKQGRTFFVGFFSFLFPPIFCGAWRLVVCIMHE